MPLVSVDQDLNDDGAGAISASQNTVFANNKAIIIVGDLSAPDSKCPTENGNHCTPNSATGSSNVFVTNKAVHRKDDLRTCGAKTVVIGQSTVFANS